MRLTVATVCLFLAVSAFASTVWAQGSIEKESAPRYVPGEVIVQFRVGTSNERMHEIIHASGAIRHKLLGTPLIFLLRFSNESPLERNIVGLRTNPEVLNVHPNRNIRIGPEPRQPFLK